MNIKHPSTNQTGILFSIVLFTLFLVSPFFAEHAAAANPGEAYGWFASKVDYIGVALGCSTDQAALDIQLAQPDSKLPASDIAVVWSVYVRDISGTIVRSTRHTRQTLSTPICFDPRVESTQVVVNDSRSYREFTSPSITSGAELSSMIGYHFRGYVHLDVKSDNRGAYIAGLFPAGHSIRINPVFYLQTNRLQNLYNTSSLESIKIYAVNLSTNNYTTLVTDASGDVGIRAVNGMTALPQDGNYFWVYHQNLNGTFNTSKPSSVLNWTFRSLPTSGVTRPLSFIYDTTAPTINSIGSVRAIQTTAPQTVSTAVRVSIQDITSGVDTSTLLVRDNLNALVAVVEAPLQQQKDNLTITIEVVLPESKTYSFVNVLQDAAGNVSTSTSISFTVPSAASLVLPTVAVHIPQDVRTTQANLRAQVTNGGGSLVSARGTCWELASGDFTSATNTPRCRVAYQTSTGFSNDVYSFTHSPLSSSTIIYYRGFATNGSGTSFSPISSTTTLPYANATTSSAVAPFLSLAYRASTTADSSRLGGKIDSTGGAVITFRAICWALAISSLPVTPNTSSSCYSLPAISSMATLPHWYDRVFYGLPYNTVVYHRAYAANNIGTSTMTNSFTTLPAYLDFDVLDYTVTSTYNTSTDSYDLVVPVRARDLSNFVVGVDASNNPLRRTIPYTVTIKRLDGTVIDAKTGTIEARNQHTTSALESVSFSNIPFGFTMIEARVNNPESTYMESMSIPTAMANNTRMKVINLFDPKLTEDIVTGGGSGFGPVMRDPGFEISFGKIIVRSYEQTDLKWDTKINYPMACQIIGPSTFGTDGVYTFDPSAVGSVGTVSTGILTSAQIFKLTCTEPITGSTFSTSTRVEVIGSLKEI